VRFKHPLYAAAAVAIAGRAATRLAHGSLARVVADPEQIAVHLDASTIGPNELVAEALLNAARSVFHRGAATRAEELANRAVERAAPTSPIRPLATTILGEVAFLRGHLIEAEQVLNDAVEALPPAVSGAARIALFRVIFERDFTRAGSYLEQAIAVTAPGPELADLQMWHAQVLTGEMRMADAQAAAEAAYASALLVGDPGLLAEATAVGVVVAMMAGRGLDRAKLDDALRTRDPARPWHPIADPLLVETICRNWAGEHEAAVQAALALADHLELREATVMDAFTLGAGIASSCALGRTDIADALHRRAGSRSGAGAGYFKTSGYLATAYSVAFSGDADRTVDAMAELRETSEATGTRMPQMPLVTARPLALVLNLAGRFAELDAQIGPLAAFAMAADYPEPGVVAWVADWAGALVELGRIDEAEAALDWLGHKADSLERTWVQGLVARERSHIAATRNELDHAIELASRSIELLTDPPNPFEVARSRLQLGLLYRRKRMRRAAAAELDQALVFFQASGHDALAARTRADLDRIVGARADANELTAAERGVAQLAADGLTNSEIAARLNISGKTVEGHLSRVFRKLQVRRRVDLPRALVD
jgi:DNA-binding CsgD family transcriptional regulator